MDDQQTPAMILSIVVPVRDEEARLGACLRSLVAQSEPGWQVGEHWELLLVDDGSTDRTMEEARAFPQVRILKVPQGSTGRAHAAQAGADAAQGRWLLFTSAEAVFPAEVPVSRAMVEAERSQVPLLSYGPRVLARDLLARSVLPLVYSELATAYPAAQVNDGAKRIGYADPAFFLVRADAYRELGGYPASTTPEVDLAFLAKRRKLPVRYRYAPEAVAVEARGFSAVWQEWTGRLASLINNALPLSLWRVLDVLLLWGLPLLAAWNPSVYPWAPAAILLIWARTVWRIWRRAARSAFPAGDLLLSLVLGLPLFAALAYASWFRVRVSKGRAR